MTVSTMQVSTAERQQSPTAPVRAAHSATAAAPRRAVRARSLRRPGPGTGPQSRPDRRLDSPVLTRAGAASPQACRVRPPQLAERGTGWRLTDRAIALVLVTGLVLVTSALAVVGLTAVRVTGDHYQGRGPSWVVASAPPALP